MTTRLPDPSPQTYARLGGALYLAIILLGVFSEGFVMSKLLVSGDTAATARNILAAPGLWRVAVAANVLLVLCAVPLLWIEYLLLRPVSKSLVLLAAFLNLVSLSVEAVSKVFMLLVMPTLESGQQAPELGAQQVEMLANFALKAHGVSFNVALLFFGATCLVNGHLIFKSSYFPKAVGVLMQVAGASYLVACAAALFAPVLAAVLLPGLLVLPFVGELSFCLWLLVKGVDRAGWQAQAAQNQKLRAVALQVERQGIHVAETA